MQHQTHRVAWKIVLWYLALPLACLALSRGLIFLCAQISALDPYRSTWLGLCGLPSLPMIVIFALGRTLLPTPAWAAYAIMLLVGVPLQGAVLRRMIGTASPR